MKKARKGLRGSAGWCGEVPFSGAFLPLDRLLELESQEPITHHASTLEVAALPGTLRNASSPEHSKLSRAIWFWCCVRNLLTMSYWNLEKRNCVQYHGHFLMENSLFHEPQSGYSTQFKGNLSIFPVWVNSDQIAYSSFLWIIGCRQGHMTQFQPIRCEENQGTLEKVFFPIKNDIVLW